MGVAWIGYDSIVHASSLLRGAGAFVETANDYDDFARAFLRKLLRELTPLISRNNTVPRATRQETHAGRQNAYDVR